MANSFDNVLIYEDEPARGKKFLPLTYTRAVSELHTGAFTGIERVQALFREAKIYLHTRPELKQAAAVRHLMPVNEVPVGATLLINAREALTFDPNNHWHVYDELPREICEALVEGEPIEPPEPIREDAPASLWEVIHANARAIRADVETWSLMRRSVERPQFPHVIVIQPENLLVHPDAKIAPGVVLDCTEGEIIIEAGVRIMPQTAIVGPAFIGKHSIIKIGAKIYEGTSVGPVSKIGGEVENSIVQGYSNKQHDGYLGHSFLGEWVNLGAGTNTSDLKNDYSPVRVTIEGEEFQTNSKFVGLMMGDHSKSAIGTQFNTGTIVGVSSNVFGGSSDAGFPPKWIPSFSWGGAPSFVPYQFEKAIAVATIVMGRRNIQMSAEEEAVLQRLYQRSQSVSV